MNSIKQIVPCESAIQYAFGAYTTEELGVDAWNLMQKQGMDAVYHKYEHCYVIEALEDISDEQIQLMIEIHANNIQQAMTQVRQKAYADVVVAVGERATVEEVMDYLVVEMNEAKESGVVHEFKADIDFEKKAADFIANRIENGDLNLDEIPKLMARYGMMDSHGFVEEITERINNGIAQPDEEIFELAILLCDARGIKLVKDTGDDWFWESMDGVDASESFGSINKAAMDAMYSQFNERDWECAIEKNEFSGSWKNYMEKNIYEEIEKTFAHKGFFTGTLINVSNGVAIQKTGRSPDDVVKHAVCKLTGPIIQGSDVDIQYSHGVGVVVDRKIEVQR